MVSALARARTPLAPGAGERARTSAWRFASASARISSRERCGPEPKPAVGGPPQLAPRVRVSRLAARKARARTLAVVSGVPASTSMAAALVLAMVAAVTAHARGAVLAASVRYRVPARVLPLVPCWATSNAATSGLARVPSAPPPATAPNPRARTPGTCVCVSTVGPRRVRWPRRPPKRHSAPADRVRRRAFFRRRETLFRAKKLSGNCQNGGAVRNLSDRLPLKNLPLEMERHGMGTRRRCPWPWMPPLHAPVSWKRRERRGSMAEHAAARDASLAVLEGVSGMDGLASCAPSIGRARELCVVPPAQPKHAARPPQLAR